MRQHIPAVKRADARRAAMLADQIAFRKRYAAAQAESKREAECRRAAGPLHEFLSDYAAMLPGRLRFVEVSREREHVESAQRDFDRIKTHVRSNRFAIGECAQAIADAREEIGKLILHGTPEQVRERAAFWRQVISSIDLYSLEAEVLTEGELSNLKTATANDVVDGAKALLHDVAKTMDQLTLFETQWKAKHGRN